MMSKVIVASKTMVVMIKPVMNSFWLALDPMRASYRSPFARDKGALPCRLSTRARRGSSLELCTRAPEATVGHANLLSIVPMKQ